MFIPDELAVAYAFMRKRHSSFVVYLIKRPLRTIMDESVNTAGTDGKNIFVSPSFFASMTFDKQAFVWCHEIVHCMLDHAGLHYGWRQMGTVTGRLHSGTIVTYPYNNTVTQQAFDYLINDMLINCGFTVEQMGTGGLHDVSLGRWTDHEADIYVRLYKRLDDQGKVPPPNAPPGGGPGKGGDDCQPAPPVVFNPAEKDAALKEALTQLAKDRGDMAGNLRMLVERVAPTRTDWREIVRPMIKSSIGRGKRDWARPDLPLLSLKMVEPANISRRAGVVCLGLDTSGSVSKKEREVWLGSLADMFKQTKPKEIILLEVDARVHQATHIKNPTQLRDFIEKAQNKGLRGNGGTDMRVIGQWLRDKEISPSLTIVLTDGYTPFPSSIEPSKRVVWVSTTEAKAPPHAGETVRINVD